MKPKTGLFLLLGVAAFSLLIAACGRSGPASTPTPSGPTPTPFVVSPQANELGTPTPTPVPPLERAVTLDFAIGQRAIARGWDQFHADFDEWREGLTACDASSVRVSLRDFAAGSIAITEAARRLPRDSAVRGLADKAIAAAEREEGAIRHLRDNWQPGARAVFDNVDTQRSLASALQKDVQDTLSDLRVRTAPLSRGQVNAFSSAFQSLNSDWDEFHRRYDSFRTEEAQLTASQTVVRLSQMVEEFRDIVIAVRELPTSEVTRQAAQTVATAAEDEDLALRQLRDTLERSEEVSGQQADGARGDSPPAAPDGGPAPTEDGGLAPFDAFDAQLVKSNGRRRQAVEELAQVFQDTSQENHAAAQAFATRYDLALQEWDAFHNEYDAWRQSEGGCDRSEATATLGQFAVRFGALAGQVRALPRATFLRPMGELFVEAAEREEEALRVLRNTWRPFDSEVYNALNQERNDAGRLRRQVAAGVQDLLSRYGISIQELETER